MTTTNTGICAHCGESNKQAGITLQSQNTAEILEFCCSGCKNVYEIIQNEGLDDFYKIRTQAIHAPEDVPKSTLEELKYYDQPEFVKDFVYESEDSCETTLLIEGITCAACIWLLERRITSLPGVTNFTINHTSFRASLAWNKQAGHLSDILGAFLSLGYKARPFAINEAEQQFDRERKQSLLRLAIAGLGMMQNMMFAVPLYVGLINGISENFELLFRLISLFVATPVVFFSARPFFSAAIRDVKTRTLSMDVPVSLAIGFAYLSSVYVTMTGGKDVYFDSVSMFTFFLLLGRHLEMQARLKSNESINTLTGIMPATAIKMTGQSEQVIPVTQIAIGDTLLIRPGNVIPADGIIETGSTSVDEAALTGEFMPVNKGKSDPVIAGTTNIENPITVTVEKIGQGTRINAIMRLLEHAQREKPPIAILANRISGYFVALVLLICAGTFIVWNVIHPERAFEIALSVLVVTCPCALSLATPAALTAATSFLRAKGFLITRGHALEALATTQHVIFDKTGTLTQGNISIQSIEVLSGNKERLANIASSLEKHSEHPIARAFAEYAGALPVEEMQNYVGKGIEGVIMGTSYRIGKPAFIAEWLKDPQINEFSDGHWVLLANKTQLLAAFGIADKIRETAANAIDLIRKKHIDISLLSGDQPQAVNTIASALGITRFFSEATPESKLHIIKEMFNNGQNIAMVGDGLNDVPALAGAPLSIAMGSANELAKLKADAILLSGNLETLDLAFRTGQRTRKIIRQNLGWAISYNLLALPLAIIGMIPPWAAAIGMSLSSLVVVLNSLRLTRA